MNWPNEAKSPLVHWDNAICMTFLLQVWRNLNIQKYLMDALRSLQRVEKLLLQLKHNSVVTMATNAIRLSCLCSTWMHKALHPGGAKTKKAFVKVPQPLCFLTTKTWAVWIFICRDTDLNSGQTNGGGLSQLDPFTVQLWIAVQCSDDGDSHYDLLTF